ncbi:hypothetical protein [Aestuariivirga sp.]|uniref:hypothetical protein n=1 Tax=Aestuariivirga sp. TaxID=2650926 RepID=UPI0039E3A9CB
MTKATPAAARIIVVGAGKSGTSALYYSLKSAAERHYGKSLRGLFEPKTPEQIADFSQASGVTKVLLERLVKMPDWHALVRGFSARVAIVRDPRDSIISRLMWIAATRLNRVGSDHQRKVRNALLRKENTPSSLSVMELCKVVGTLHEYPDRFLSLTRELAYLPAVLVKDDSPLFNIHYEDFIAHNVAALEQYLGFPLPERFELPVNAQLIRRTASSGNWKNWFLPEDFRYFVDPMISELSALGYTDERSSIGRQIISPDEISAYLERADEKFGPATA